jgi:hypothetical protein
MIRNEGREEKQEYERNAVKRYLKERGAVLRRLKPPFLGDDLYASHSVGKRIAKVGMSFIFMCEI